MLKPMMKFILLALITLNAFASPREEAQDILTRFEGYQAQTTEIWRGSSENDLEIGDTVVVTSIDNEKLIAQVKKVNKE